MKKIFITLCLTLSATLHTSYAQEISTNESTAFDMFYKGWQAQSNKNYKEAMKLYKEASSEGCSAAQFHIAQMYEDGLGVSKDYQKALQSYEEIAKEEETALEDILKVEMLELTLGYQLIRLADSSQGGDLLERIRSMRRKIASDFGFLMPQVRIRDNLHLAPQQYQILLKGKFWYL